MASHRKPFVAAVTGLGVVCAAGVGVEEAWHNVAHGSAPVSVGPLAELHGLPCDFMYTVPGLDPDRVLGAAGTRLMDRFAQLAVIAAREAVADAGLGASVWDSGRVAVVIGSAHGGLVVYDAQQDALSRKGPRRVSPMVAPLSAPNNAASSVCMDLGARGPSLAVSATCCSGTIAIGTAHQLLRAGVCDIAVAGGAESVRSRLIFAGTCRMRALSTRRDDPATACRPFDVDRDGFVIGEGAGLLVMERPEHARARGARVRAGVAGYASTSDAHNLVAPHPDGAGIEQAMRAALTDAGVGGGDVGHVNAHGTSTVLNDLIEGSAIHRVLGDDALVTSTKAMTGHALGAAGGIETVLTVRALETQLVPPTVNLTTPDPAIPAQVVRDGPRKLGFGCAVKTSLGVGGHNAALVLVRE